MRQLPLAASAQYQGRMSAPASQPEFLTTREVAELLRVKERKVYDMAAEGEIPHRRVTGKLLFPRAALEAWIRGDPGPGAMPAPAAVIAGSHDPLLDWAIRESGSGIATLFDGSLDGLERLAAGDAMAAGLHVIEPEAGEWNVGHVRARLGQAPVVLVEWARRRQGLIVPAGREAEFRGVADLAGRRVVRRQPSAGAGLWLAHLLSEAGVSADTIDFLPEIARTETDAALAVMSGAAEAAPGLAALARQFGLGFVALIDERFDLAIDRRSYFEEPLQRLVDFARSDAFAARAAQLGGYGLSGHGQVRWNGP